MKRPAVKCPHTPPQDDPLEIFEDPIQPEGPGDTGGAGEPGDSEVVDAPDGPDEIDSKLFDSMKRELVQMEGAIAFWKLRFTIQKEEARLKDLASMNFEVSLVRKALGASCPVNLFEDLQERFKDFATTMHIATSSDPLE